MLYLAVWTDLKASQFQRQMAFHGFDRSLMVLGIQGARTATSTGSALASKSSPNATQRLLDAATLESLNSDDRVKSVHAIAFSIFKLEDADHGLSSLYAPTQINVFGITRAFVSAFKLGREDALDQGLVLAGRRAWPGSDQMVLKPHFGDMDTTGMPESVRTAIASIPNGVVSVANSQFAALPGADPLAPLAYADRSLLALLSPSMSPAQRYIIQARSIADMRS